MGISVEIHRVAQTSIHCCYVLLYVYPPLVKINWNFKMLVFVKGGKPEKNYRSKNENQQQIKPHMTPGQKFKHLLVGGKCSHHCAIPSPQDIILLVLC